MIETKIDAGYQPRQLEDYMKRAASYEQQDPDLQAVVLLIAPESYSREHDDERIHRSVELVRAVRSTSTRVHVPFLDISMGFEQQHQNAAEEIRRAKEMFAVFTSPGT